MTQQQISEALIYASSVLERKLLDAVLGDYAHISHTQYTAPCDAFAYVKDDIHIIEAKVRNDDSDRYIDKGTMLEIKRLEKLLAVKAGFNGTVESRIYYVVFFADRKYCVLDVTDIEPVATFSPLAANTTMNSASGQSNKPSVTLNYAQQLRDLPAQFRITEKEVLSWLAQKGVVASRLVDVPGSNELSVRNYF